ncbi:epimerase [Olivibacter ginsenosidimutans]|uniref:Epimerase n=1 Tax=Olivibacter ginsenosidimutans TaxID=1176537 RepID=A0ABP9BC04_9SPHI
MKQYKVIITGTTGMVGEGVLLTCLADPEISEVLSVSRKATKLTHSKLKEYLVPNFLHLQSGDPALLGYDACFFCAGISSVGMSEEKYTNITYTITVHFAKILAELHPHMVFTYVSGAGTDSSEKGRIMWARVKGRTENTLIGLPFKKVYNFRPAFMKPVPGQQHTLALYTYLGWLFPVLKLIAPKMTSTLHQVGLAMIKCVTIGTEKSVLEVSDINQLARA